MNARAIARVLVKLTKKQSYAHVHDAADSSLATFRSAMKKAFAAGHKAALPLLGLTEHELMAQADKGVTATATVLKLELPKLLTRVRDESAKGTVSKLKLRAAADIKGWSFDASAQSAVDWAAEHSAELVTGISATTREDLQAIISDALSQDALDSATLTEDIAAALGDDARAELIARTETMRAANEGQLEAWDQAVDEGFLTGDEQKEWIATGDEVECPICEDLDGETVALDETFDADGEDIDGPPAHPNCRCTIGLVAPKVAWVDKTGFDSHGREPKNAKAERAIASFKASTKDVQDKGEQGEKLVAKMTGGTRTGDNKPIDHTMTVNGKLHGIEVKTLVHNENDKITMHKSSLKRKVAWGRKNGATLHTVVVDMRGGKSEMYYRAGVGSFRLHTMTKVKNAAHLRSLMGVK